MSYFLLLTVACCKILPDRFQYVVAARITVSTGQFYFHYMARDKDTRHNGREESDALQTTKGAFLAGEVEKYRDVDIHVNIPEFERVVEQARDMVLMRRLVIPG